MKIGMLISDFWPGPQGGTEKQCEKLSAEIARRGHEISVITSWPGIRAPRRECYQGYRVVRCGALRPLLNGVRRLRIRVRGRTREAHVSTSPPVKDKPSRKKIRFLAPLQWMDKAFFMLEAARQIKSLSLELLHVHECHWIAGFGAWLGHRLDIPVVCKEATFPALPAFEPDVPWAGFLRRQRLQCDRYIALTAQMAESLIAQGIEAERVKVIPNGVPLFPPVPWNERDPHMVLCVANLTQGLETKGIHTLIEAWHEVAKRIAGARLVILGRGNLKQLALGTACPPEIEWMGYVEDPDPYYRTASLFVLPSRTEGMSNALLEAQSWGIPAVVTDIPGSRAVITPDVNGKVVAVGDSVAMAKAIVALLEDSVGRERMGRESRRIVEERFSMGRIADQWIKLYSETLASRQLR